MLFCIFNDISETIHDVLVRNDTSWILRIYCNLFDDFWVCFEKPILWCHGQNANAIERAMTSLINRNGHDVIGKVLMRSKDPWHHLVAEPCRHSEKCKQITEMSGKLQDNDVMLSQWYCSKHGMTREKTIEKTQNMFWPAQTHISGLTGSPRHHNQRSNTIGLAYIMSGVVLNSYSRRSHQIEQALQLYDHIGLCSIVRPVRWQQCRTQQWCYMQPC